MSKRYKDEWKEKISESVKKSWKNRFPLKDKNGKRILPPETRKKLSEAAIRGNKNRKYKRKDLEELKSPVHMRERLFEERGRKCERCGWEELNPHTGIVPVQVNHKDGNRKNNKRENLEILCPNCHSLTKHFMFYGRSHRGTYGKKGTKRYR